MEPMRFEDLRVQGAMIEPIKQSGPGRKSSRRSIIIFWQVRAWNLRVRCRGGILFRNRAGR